MGSGLATASLPGTTTTRLTEECSVEVAPLRVLLFEKPDFPIAPPFFDFFLAADRNRRIVKNFEPD
jgi:hypothetical protein